MPVAGNLYEFMGEEEGWVPLRGPTPVTDLRVWHYTSVQGMVGIVQTQTLWASSPIAMNDASEIQYGRELIRGAWLQRGMREGQSGDGPVMRAFRAVVTGQWLAAAPAATYVVSACEDGDLLTQWQRYAGSTGYALELDTGTPLAIYSDEGLSGEITYDDFMRSGWYRVIYDLVQQVTQINELLDSIVDRLTRRPLTNEYDPDPTDLARIRSFQRQMDALAVIFKDVAFAPEREVRFVITRPHQVHESFRPGPRGPIPFVAVTAVPTDRAAEVADTRGRLPITTVHVGPLPRSEHWPAKQTIRRLLLGAGYDAVNVYNSEIPYRF